MEQNSAAEYPVSERATTRKSALIPEHFMATNQYCINTV
jgi:hypothetical protein